MTKKALERCKKMGLRIDQIKYIMDLVLMLEIPTNRTELLVGWIDENKNQIIPI